MADRTYRERLYERYATTQRLGGAPEELLEPRAAYFRRLIRQHLPADRAAPILELGCGHGALLYYLREAGYRRYLGVDRSPEQVALAVELGIDNVEQHDLGEFLGDQPDESWDVVVAFDVVEHLTKAELLDLAAEVHRVLAPGGRWVIHLPNGVSPFFGRVRYGDYTHEQAFTPVSLDQFLRVSGFQNVECYEDTPIVHGVKSAARWALWQGVRTFLQLWLLAETGSAEPVVTQNFLAVVHK